MQSSPDLSFVVPSISRDFRSLYDANFAFVWRYMAHRGVAIAQIDDLVQNVFRIVREHPSRHDASRSRAVLVGMVSRQVLREFKKRTAGMEAPEIGEGVTMNFSRHAAGQVLDAVLEGMTETQREVLLLSQGENMNNRDIGDTLGVPEAVVQQRLEAAAKLMTQLVAKLRMHPIWDSLSKSSRDARALMDAAQRARTPNDSDRERVFAALLASSISGAAAMASGAAVVATARQHTEPVLLSSPPPAAPQSVAPPVVATPPAPEPVVAPQLSPLETQEILQTGKSKPLVWAAVAFAAVAMGIGGYGLNSWLYAGSGTAQAAEQSTGTARGELVAEPTEVAAEPEPVAAAAPEPEPAAQPMVEQLTPEPVVEEPTPEEPVARVARATTRRRVQQAPAAKSGHRSNPPDEARQLFAIERTLRAGESKLALDMLNELERQFPQSRLEVERDALRAQILCERGRTKAARKVILELEADNADKPLLAAVDEACQPK